MASQPLPTLPAAPAATPTGTQPAPASGTAPAADFTSPETDNSGGSFDAGAFWNTETETQDSVTQPDANAVRDGLTQQLSNLDFGAALFDADITQQINEGNFEGVNKRMQEMGSSMVRQSLALTVSILRPLTDQILNQVREEISGTLNTRDDGEQLVRDFPAAKDPKIRPVVENLYRQALKNTKGNRQDAITQVKSMLTLVTQSTADDLGLDVAARGADDFGRSRSPAINWLDELSST
jgi:hypothetical protein